MRIRRSNNLDCAGKAQRRPRFGFLRTFGLFDSLTRTVAPCFLLFAFVAVSEAAVIRYEATGTFTRSDFPTEIAPGDRFTVSFAYNDGVTDTNAAVLAGRFPGAVLYFNFQLLQGAIGNYPGGVATVFQPIDTFDGTGEGPAAIPARFYLAAAGENLPPLNGHPLGSVLFVLDDDSHTSSIRDTGLGQSLGSLLGGNLELGQFKNTLLRVSAVGKNGLAEGIITSLVVLPEPVLSVSRQSSDKLRIGWSTNHPNAVLEWTGSLTAPRWQPADDPPILQGSEFSLVFQLRAGSQFFRLRLP